MKLSILMPVYNESATLLQALKRVLDVDYPCEIELVAVDDGSVDDSLDLLRWSTTPGWRDRARAQQGQGRRHPYRVRGGHRRLHDHLRRRPRVPARGDPAARAGHRRRGEVVYGTRSFGSHNAYSYWYVLGNRGVTLAANLLFNCYISDLETCFKLLPTALYRRLDIQAAGFGMEAQVTARAAEERGPALRGADQLSRA